MTDSVVSEMIVPWGCLTGSTSENGGAPPSAELSERLFDVLEVPSWTTSYSRCGAQLHRR